MNEKEKNVTKEKDLPFIELKRVDCLEQKNKDNETYYMVSGLFENGTRSDLVKLYFKDKDLYNEILAVPGLNKFKLYYDLSYYNDTFRLIPVACSL